jgi:hypothetical protein
MPCNCCTHITDAIKRIETLLATLVTALAQDDEAQQEFDLDGEAAGMPRDESIPL